MDKVAFLKRMDLGRDGIDAEHGVAVGGYSGLVVGDDDDGGVGAVFG